jgi:FMN reductase
MYTVFSTSLNAESRSRLLAKAAVAYLQEHGHPVQLIDLAEVTLPFCDASYCYAHPNVVQCRQAIEQSNAILLATPVYNYDVSAAAKNLVELTGRAWTDKLVGFLAAAGGFGSYMSVMGLANSLMLDFRSVIIPRFVYATGAAFEENQVAQAETLARIAELAESAVRMGEAWKNANLARNSR